MPQYLIMRLDGPMQAWGRHSYEDYRPSHSFPTRSGIVGLIAGCMGIERNDVSALQNLSENIILTVRTDKWIQRPEQDNKEFRRHLINMVDYHTVLDARKVDGKPNPNPVVSRREYLYDASFTVVLRLRENANLTLDMIADALKRPVYTPVLGRRNCPLARPLFERMVDGASALDALQNIAPGEGTIYTEEQNSGHGTHMAIRDVPMYQRSRTFGNRVLFVVNHGEKG